MAKKKVTTRTCGKCKTAFLVGQGHDARTCGKARGASETAANLPAAITTQFVRRKELNGGGFSNIGSSGLHESKRKKKVFSVGVTENKKVLVKTNKWANYMTLSDEWLKTYTHVTDGKTTAWFNKDGLLHRKDGPAMKSAARDEEWYVNGERHRLDGPAVEWFGGTKEWYVEGKRHRLDGPAAERANGDKEWWVDGKRHRLDGPAVERADGSREWHVEGLPVPTKYNVVCEKATSPETTREEFFHLIQHESSAVRAIALNNPVCPAEWRVLARLLPPTQS